MEDGDAEASVSRSGPSRRQLLAGAAIGGAAVVGGVVGGGTAAAASGPWRRQTLAVDVACLGETWRDSPTRNPADAADFRQPFLVEGWIYPSGTVGDGFVPTGDGTIGRWFCQGWLILDGTRPEPHASSTHSYLFGEIGSDQLFPADTLYSIGLEGTEQHDQPMTRAISGGSGRYLAASGAIVQEIRGLNTTVLDDGTDLNAPNFAFTFDLVLPDL